MDFQVSALGAEQFKHLFGQDTDTLTSFGVRRLVADRKPGFPCRVSLRDVEIGETILLLNYEHQPSRSPYRSCHAIIVREWAVQAQPRPNEVPDVLRRRMLSVRGFDHGGMLLDADLVDGHSVERLVAKLLSNPSVACLHVHNAKPGCYAARVERA